MSAEDFNRYMVQAHKMQCGVGFLNHETEMTPKHLRVGVNAAMSDQAGLVKLLIAKGVFTEDEYTKAIADAMESEANRYKERLEEKYPGKKFELH